MINLNFKALPTLPLVLSYMFWNETFRLLQDLFHVSKQFENSLWTLILICFHKQIWIHCLILECCHKSGYYQEVWGALVIACSSVHQTVNWKTNETWHTAEPNKFEWLLFLFVYAPPYLFPSTKIWEPRLDWRRCAQKKETIWKSYC